MFFNPYFYPFFLPYFPGTHNYQSTHLSSYKPANLLEYDFSKINFPKTDFKETNNVSGSNMDADGLPLRYPQSLRTKSTSGQGCWSKKKKQQYSIIQRENRPFQICLINKNKKQQQQSKQNDQKKVKNNSISNILRMFLRKITNETQQFQTLISYIINKYDMNITVKKFIQWLQQQEINHRIYLTLQTAQKYFNGPSHTQDCYKIMRILFEQFIRTKSLLCYLTSKKMKKQSLKTNLKMVRTIKKLMFSENRK